MISGRVLLKASVIAILLLICPALASDDRVAVNMMIDLELSPYAMALRYLNESTDTNHMIPIAYDDTQKIEYEFDSRRKILNEIQPKGLNVTLYLTGDYLDENVGNYLYNLSVSSLSNNPNYEMALLGTTTDERLANMSYAEQDRRIAESKRKVEDAHICGGREMDVKGFRPQNFSQNEDTYLILDNRIFSYDAGYQAGLIYLPGHEKDTWPYPVNNHSFYAVPVSTHKFNGDLIPMSDRFALEKGLTGLQWRDLLISEYDECAENGDPMVVIFHNWVIGLNNEYFDAFKEFVAYATFDNAKFVTTQQLVDMSRS
jgi:hypothetical protein